MKKSASNPQRDPRDLIATLPPPVVSADFVARTVAAARQTEQDPAESKVIRAPWLKIASLAAAAAIILALSVDALRTAPAGGSKLALSEVELVDPAVVVAASVFPEEREYVQLMLALDSDTEFEGDDLLAFAL